MENIKVRCITDSLKLIKLGEEYEVTNNPRNNLYYVRTSKGLMPYLKERFEVVTEKIKDHNDFEVGDIVTYIPNSRENNYYRTNQNGTYKILSLSDIQMDIRVVSHIEHPSVIGNVWTVDKHCFKYVEDQVKTEDRTPTEKVVERTEKEIMEGITYSYINNTVYADVPHKTGTLKYRTALPRLSLAGSNISCGVNEGYNLNGLNLANFKSNFSVTTRYPQNYVTQNIYEEMLKQVFKMYFDNYKIGFLIMSTNLTTNVNHCNLLTKILEEFDFVTMSETHNRNSNHKIRLWVCDLYKNQVTDKSKK